MRKRFVVSVIFLYLLVALLYLYWPPVLWLLVLLVPFSILGVYDMLQTEHSLRRNFPGFGRGRWLAEQLRPFIRQYFIESDTDGMPVNRMFRSVVYQRAKGTLDTLPFGTKVDTYLEGYEWISHSLAALDVRTIDQNPRVLVGGPDCLQPYSASILNISAMSFGALSSNAIMALNKGARTGGFAHNTGEGSVSPHHLKYGGDLIWQIGTGYFGCRDASGHFCEKRFQDRAASESVRMIEIKLSQGAKPGHGGILPADKNTAEIAAIRGVVVNTQVDSPPVHSAFSTPMEMMFFIKKLRDLSGGKPVGFKLCVGRESEFVALCKAMVKTGIKPDFITVDGGEGGTGAAPLEFSNYTGMPLREGLAFVCDCLNGFDLKKDIKVIASGKLFTGSHLVKNLSLGADICNSARGMMLALGCVQSLVCNANKCPTGIATQDPRLVAGLVVSDKAERVANFQRATVRAALDIISSAGLESPQQLNRTYIFRRINQFEVKRYDEIFPYLATGSLLGQQYPERFHQAMIESCAESFLPSQCIAQVDEHLQAVES
jgi:glutamate synthase domain-containing protein 2